MCDTVPGELIVSFPRGDPTGSSVLGAIADILPQVQDTAEASVEDTSVGLGSMDELLVSRDIDYGMFPFEFHRVRVPTVYEEPIARWIKEVHSDLSQRPEESSRGPSFDLEQVVRRPSFQVASNTRISASSSVSGATDGSYEMATEAHLANLTAIGCGAPPSVDLSSVRVAVIDSGLSDPIRSELVSTDSLVAEHDFVTDAANAVDEFGHGSVMTQIIVDGAPGVQVHAIRVLDRNGFGSEWELVAGIQAAVGSGATLLNMSLATGLGGPDHCRTCGRRRAVIRARTLETALDQINGMDWGGAVQAAAGNGGKESLDFPARFPNVSAVAGVNSREQFGAYTNRGTIAWHDRTHLRRWAAPGGEGPPTGTAGEVSEWVATYSSGERVYGTSPATAYATATMARAAGALSAGESPTFPSANGGWTFARTDF